MIKFKIGHTYKNLFSEQFSPLTVVKRVPLLHIGEAYIYSSDYVTGLFARYEDNVEVIKSVWGVIYRADEEV